MSNTDSCDETISVDFKNVETHNAMKLLPFHDDQELLLLEKQSPTIAITLTFEPKMSSWAELQDKLRDKVSEARERLKESYSHEKCFEVMRKLNKIISELDYLTHKKSVAIFVSPQFEKIYYLDMPVNDRVVVDENFCLKDLVRAKKDSLKYLLLVLGGEWSKVYLGSQHKFSKIVSNVAGHIEQCRRDLPGRVANFTDPMVEKEVLIKKFLRYTDSSLSILLEAYPLPLFVMGSEKTIGYFNKLTRNKQSIIGYIPGSYVHISEPNILAAISPYLTDWKKVKHQDLLNQLEVAAGADKLATGIHEVWKEATHKKGKLLLLEKDHQYNWRKSKRVPGILNSTQNENSPFQISDGVDELIEEVLQSGGDIEFVEEGFLKEYDHIALIQYY